MSLPFLDRPFSGRKRSESDRPSDLPSLWGLPAVCATLRLQVGLGFQEPFDHVEVAHVHRQTQSRVASEVQKGAKEASNGSIDACSSPTNTMQLKVHAMGSSALFKERAFAFAVGGIFGPTKLQHQLNFTQLEMFPRLFEVDSLCLLVFPAAKACRRSSTTLKMRSFSLQRSGGSSLPCLRPQYRLLKPQCDPPPPSHRRGRRGAARTGLG